MIPQQLSISLPFPPIRKGGLQWFEPSAVGAVDLQILVPDPLDVPAP